MSREYDEFLRQQVQIAPGLYEHLCVFAERVLPIRPWAGLNKKYEDAMAFSHMKATPKGAFSLAVLGFLIVLITPLVLSILMGAFSAVLLMIILVFAGIVFYYLYDYPTHYSILFRIRASSEMVLAVIYISIAMRISPNLENAIKFAAHNLTGPLSIDMRTMLWDVYMRKYDTISDALDVFISKWKVENKEFTEAIYLIKTSFASTAARREGTLDEAVSVVLEGTKERMKHYAQGLRTPVTVLNAMGIILPIIGLVFLPMMGLFLSEIIRPSLIAVGYNILLPFCVYWMMKSTLEKRPYSFHQPDISKHPKFKAEGVFNKTLLMSLLMVLPVLGFGAYEFMTIKESFSDILLYVSLSMLFAVTGGIVFYCIFSTWKKLKIREEVVEIESGFAEALFQIGKQLKRGIPIEKAVERFVANMKDLRISRMFEEILYNINTFGMTFEQAIFNEEHGAIRNYPSKTIEMTMRAIVEISKRGMDVVSNAMVSISRYLKDAHAVEEDLKDMLSETTSTMSIQALLLAPLTSGIVIVVSAIMMQMLISFQAMVDKIQSQLISSGPAGMMSGGIFMSVLNINKMIPVHVFQLIVGVYLVEVVGMLALFLSTINNGDDEIMKMYNIGKMLLMGVTIYVMIALALYSVFTSIMPAVSMMV